jgi:hypothetical protein
MAYNKKKPTRKPAKKAPKRKAGAVPMMTMGSATGYITKQMTAGGKPSSGAIKMAEGILRAAGKKRYGGKNVPVKRGGGKTKK